MSKRNRTAYEDDATQSSGYVLCGTPLPPLDPEIRDDGSFVPIWKQEVRDERGRKRLHGAFTGGFSAGYFNTVGSKEGWTPATFKSSRAERAKTAQARPEDFMDEEDLAEAAEARRLETSRKFTGLGSTADELAGRNTLTVMDLFTPTPEDTMGVRLLKKMGWKEGQGIGPKIMRKAIVLDHDNMGDEVDNDDETLHFFAPANTAVIKISKKNDKHGLGYTGHAREMEEKEEITQARVAKPLTKARVGGGFGVGVLNEEDEEDEDIYEIKPKSAYNRVIGGDAKKPKKQTNSSIVKTPAKHVFVSKKASFAKNSLKLRKCHDGRLPLEGFVLSLEPMQIQGEWYPPPEVSEDWAPTLSEEPAETKSATRPSLAQEAAASKLDSRARGLILGETTLPGKSVFDFMSPASREKIAAATGRTDLPPARNEGAPPGFAQSPLTDRIPKIDKSVAASALREGFMPYADDLSKRARYRKFLEIQAGVRGGPPDRKAEMSDTDWINELNEFASCARIFKATPTMIASRFTSASSPVSHIATSDGKVSEDNPDVFLHRPTLTTKDESPAEQAARMGMYGPMTRTIEEFWPTRLLCKRFNVRPPIHVESASKNNGKENVHAGFNPSAFKGYAQRPDPPPAPTVLHPPSRQPKELISSDEITQIVREVRGDDKFELPSKEQLVAEEKNKVNVEVNEALEAERAGDDVFKAIFGDESDEDDR